VAAAAFAAMAAAIFFPGTDPARMAGAASSGSEA